MAPVPVIRRLVHGGGYRHSQLRLARRRATGRTGRGGSRRGRSGSRHNPACACGLRRSTRSRRDDGLSPSSEARRAMSKATLTLRRSSARRAPRFRSSAWPVAAARSPRCRPAGESPDRMSRSHPKSPAPSGRPPHRPLGAGARACPGAPPARPAPDAWDQRGAWPAGPPPWSRRSQCRRRSRSRCDPAPRRAAARRDIAAGGARFPRADGGARSPNSLRGCGTRRPRPD